MLIDQLSNQPIHYELILCKPNEEKICSLKEIKNLKHDAKFPTTDELTFDIPYYITKNGQPVKNPIYELVKGDYLILLNRKQGDIELGSQCFIIDTTKDAMNSDSEFKEIHAYSREYELNKKIIRDYNLISRKIYSHINEKDEEGEYVGVMNYISTLTSWSLDLSSFQDLALDNKYRSFDVSELTLLDFLISEVQRSFNIVFIFDTVNKKISAKRIDDLKFTRGLYISDQNYLKNIIKEPKHDEIVTRLYCFGKDNLSIEKLNPTGVPYIELFDFYKTTAYMSQGLINALDTYDDLLEYHKNNKTFENLYNQLSDLVTERVTLEEELSYLFEGYHVNGILIDGLKQINEKIDKRIKLDQSYNDLNTALNQKELEILNKQAQIDHDMIDPILKLRHPSFNPNPIVSNKQKIINKTKQIEDFNKLISKENNFTLEQITELDYFIREKVWMDTSYETEEELYEEAQNQIVRLAQPPVQFDIDVVDFLSFVEGKADKHKLRLGDIVYIQYDKFGIDIEVRLVGYTYVPEKNELKMTLSNTNSIDDPYLLLVDLQKNAITSSTTINMDKFKWDKSEENQHLIRQIIDRDLDLAAKRVMSTDNIGYVLDNRGLWLFEVLPDGSISPNQMRIINNLLVISEDGFKTAKLAISGNGIVGQQVIGKLIMGEKLILGDNEGTFLIKGNLLTIKDRNNLVRVLLGEYEPNRFGLKLFNQDGTSVVLDGRGIIQTNTLQLADNVDSSNPLKIKFYIDDSTLRIDKVKLSFTLEPFRAYSKGMSSDGDDIISTTSSDGGAHQDIVTSADGGADVTSTFSENYQSTHGHNHGIPEGTQLAVYPVSSGAYFTFHDSAAHTHEVKLPEHSHKININIPDHAHDFKVNIRPHTHDIQYGIYTSTSARGVNIRVNGRLVNSSSYNTDQTNIDITNYITNAGWHTVELTSTQLGRINASIFTKIFVGT